MRAEEKKDMEWGVLCMVKNEEYGIATTLRSTAGLADTIILYDTGSTDRTIGVAEQICQENRQRLHIEKGLFTTFPQSRNEALCFAGTIPVRYLLLMDAGDELRTTLTASDLTKAFSNASADCFLVTQQWVEKKDTTQHTDIRIVRNKSGMHYDPRYPVHEALAGVHHTPPLFAGIVLHQDRDVHGGGSHRRYHRDIELLSAAEPNRRNCYFLGQSYMSVDDYANGLRCYCRYVDDLAHEPHVDEHSGYTRAAYCAMMCRQPKDVVLSYLKRSIDQPGAPLDGYIYLFKYCVENKDPDTAVPYMERASKLEKINGGALMNHAFYDYTRWHLISILCLMAGRPRLMLFGYNALKRVIHLQRPNDLHNEKIYRARLAESA